jgi:CRISPR-associated protein Csb2
MAASMQAVFPVAGDTRTALEALCAKVTRIGHSSSLVQMWMADNGEIGKTGWAPDEDRAEAYLRIAVAGTLEHLEHRYNEEGVGRFASLAAIADDPSRERRGNRGRVCAQSERRGAPGGKQGGDAHLNSTECSDEDFSPSAQWVGS